MLLKFGRTIFLASLFFVTTTINCYSNLTVGINGNVDIGTVELVRFCLW